MKKKRISEATGSGGSGHYKTPIVLAPQIWKKDQVGPFTEPVYEYTNAELAYEEADGDFKESPEERKKIEKKTERQSEVDMYLKKFYTHQNDDEGSNIGQVETTPVWNGIKKKSKGNQIKMVSQDSKNESLKDLIRKVLKESFK
jgi:hypothetical protein